MHLLRAFRVLSLENIRARARAVIVIVIEETMCKSIITNNDYEHEHRFAEHEHGARVKRVVFSLASTYQYRSVFICQ